MRLVCRCVFLALTACPEPVDTDTDTETDVPVEERAHDLASWCEAVRGGPAGEAALEVGFSRAVASVRLFGIAADPGGVDAQLVDALEDDRVGRAALQRFADALPEQRCVVAAGPGEVGSVEVEQVGDVAVVRPGTGTVVLPSGVQGVVVDLRALPATPEADQALRRAVAAAVASDVDLGSTSVRRFAGWPHQWASGSVYQVSSRFEPDGIVASGTVDLPLAFVLGDQVSPGAASVVGMMRAEGRAWVWGFDLHTRVGESSWHAVGDGVGLAAVTVPRTRGLNHRLPEVVPADDDRLWSEDLIAALPALDGPQPLSAELPSVTVEEWDPFAYDPGLDNSLASRQALLLVAHGLLDRFYPYFEVVGRDVDTALIEELARVRDLDSDDRVGMTHSLGRLMHAIHDGHGFFGDHGAPLVADGYVGIRGDRVAGELLVRHSASPDLVPGDVITGVDGTPVGAWYDAVTARHSAASEGYLWNLATRELNRVLGERLLEVRGPGGDVRTVRTEGVSEEAFSALPMAGTLRPSGLLTDLDATNVFFLNMSRAVTSSDAQVRATLDELAASGATDLIVDMREYPGVNHYDVVQAILDGPYTSPRFLFPTWSGPEAYMLQESVYEFNGRGRAWSGPITLLVSNHSVSAAENFSLLLTQRADTVVVGQQSASTNGNITGAFLPGRYYLMFTGMEIRTPADEVFHGVGIVPDLPVVPEAAAVAEGRDPELEAALEMLSGT